jgi:hypothetical protein
VVYLDSSLINDCVLKIIKSSSEKACGFIAFNFKFDFS